MGFIGRMHFVKFMRQVIDSLGGDILAKKRGRIKIPPLFLILYLLITYWSVILVALGHPDKGFPPVVPAFPSLPCQMLIGFLERWVLKVEFFPSTNPLAFHASKT